MRISDWSSDVCSSDLDPGYCRCRGSLGPLCRADATVGLSGANRARQATDPPRAPRRVGERDGGGLRTTVGRAGSIGIWVRERSAARPDLGQSDRVKLDEIPSSSSPILPSGTMQNLDRKSTRLNSSNYCASRMQYPA